MLAETIRNSIATPARAAKVNKRPWLQGRAERSCRESAASHPAHIGGEPGDIVVTPEVVILIWWLAFGGTHVLGSSVPVRTALIGKLGNAGFKGLYSLVSFATFAPLVYVFFANKGAGALLFRPSANLILGTETLMVVALIVLAQGLATPSPMTTAADMGGGYPDKGRGIQRITRHPGNFAFALFGIAHMLSNPYVGDWIFFGGFVVYGIVSAAHQDRRTLAGGREEVASFQADTSSIPFAAILTGKQRLALGEYSKGALVIGVALAALLWYFHANVFGGYGAA